MSYYKAFEQDMTCRKYQYVVGKTYMCTDPIQICQSGFHCCANILNCLEYYPANSRFCEVEIGGKSITEKGKTVTNQLRIVREIVGDELARLLTGHVVSSCGPKLWYKEGQLHRDGDLPAVVCSNGYKEWYKEGQLHRDGDLPAIVWYSGTKWYKKGQCHRDGDLPAVVCSDGSKMWYKEGQLHRDGDLPAIVWSSGGKVWYKEGCKYQP